MKKLYFLFLTTSYFIFSSQETPDNVHAILRRQNREFTQGVVIDPTLREIMEEHKGYHKAILKAALAGAQHAKSILGPQWDQKSPSQWNEYLSTGHQANVIVAEHEDPTLGFGLFAQEEIARGTYIGEYSGELQPLSSGNCTYAWSTLLKRPSAGYPDGSQMKKLTQQLEASFGWSEDKNSEELYIDAAKKGNALSFVNHAGKNSNCFSIMVFGKDKLPHVCYIAGQNIRRGDELTVDYGKQYKLPDGTAPIDLPLYNIRK